MKKKEKKEKKQEPARGDNQAIDLLMKLTHQKKSTTTVNISECTTSSQAKSDSDQENQSVHEEWYEELSDAQTTSFKEVFDMLDSEHTGALNADDLYHGLKRVDSEITREEVEYALKVLDKDGNGKVDFDEFLMHITSHGTAKSSGNKRAGYTKRQRLFLSALRKFNYNSNLCELQKGIQPHVLEHYTAGLRLIGLTENQLQTKLKKMKKNVKNAKSPYAMPSRFVLPSGSSGHIQSARKSIDVGFSTVKRLEQETRRKSMMPVDLSQLRKFSIAARGVSRTQTLEEVSEETKSSESLAKDEAEAKETPKSAEKTKPKKPKGKKVKRGKNYKCQGWVIPKMVRYKIPLPVFQAEMRRYTLTIADSPLIREKVDEAVGAYYMQHKKAAMNVSREHWGKLGVHSIESKRLQQNFREVYHTYAPHNEREVIVICPWIPPTFRTLKKFTRRKFESTFKYGYDKPFNTA